MDTASTKTEFRAERVVSRGLSIFFKNAVPFLLLTAVVYSPLFIYAAITLGGELTLSSAMRLFYAITWGGMILQLLASGVMMHGTVAQLRGERATTAQSFAVGVKCLLPVLGVGILVGLAVMVGCLLLLVPGLILAVKYWVAVPVAVVERPGVTASMKRSAELVAGNGWSVFAIMLAVVFLGVGLNQVVQHAWDITTLTLSELKTYLAVELGVAVVTTAVSAVITAVTYHDLRVAKEEISAEDIARAILV